MADIVMRAARAILDGTPAAEPDRRRCTRPHPA